MRCASDLGWRFIAETFLHDCRSGLVREGETLALPNGYEATHAGGRVVVTAHHYDAESASWSTTVADWEVANEAD